MPATQIISGNNGVAPMNNGLSNSNSNSSGSGGSAPLVGPRRGVPPPAPSPKSPRSIIFPHRHSKPSGGASTTEGTTAALTSNLHVTITAVEEDLDFEGGGGGPPLHATATTDDVIPGPPPVPPHGRMKRRNSNSQSKSSSRTAVALLTRPFRKTISLGSSSHSGDPNAQMPIPALVDELQLSSTEHMRWSGGGILANRAELDVPPEEFAAGCNLLQAAAKGDTAGMQELLDSGKTNVNFRDYDRRTALHVAASEGHLDVCRFLVSRGSKVNRSDRWGGSPLDDAHRHRHTDVVQFLRDLGALTGSGNRSTNLITAAAEGDVDEVKMLLHTATASPQSMDVNKGDYDKRTALHLAAGEGHVDIVRLLCLAGADVNAEDRWNRRPLDDAFSGNHRECIKILQEFGAAQGDRVSVAAASASEGLDMSIRRQQDNMRVEFDELEMIDRVGAGAFGEIYKCRWRGTLVAAKIIKSAKIRRDWVVKNMMEAIQEGKDVDDAIREIDVAEMEQSEKDQALADFRQEISVLKQLRHPNIVLLLAYSTTENYECLISELMKCSLLDVFKSHMVQGTRMKHKTQIVYATQLSRGMTYLHSCKPPIIHRDLKPANLLIDPSGVLKISDFGLSRIRPDPNKKESDTFVMTGETGSYRFMAPEVYRRQYYTETVDIYSYAMILFYLLTGRPPWPTLPGTVAVRRAAEMGDRPNIPRDLDVRLQILVKECWDDNPSVRPPFTEITKRLTAYSQDVFNEREDSVVAIPSSDVDTECENCVIL